MASCLPTEIWLDILFLDLDYFTLLRVAASSRRLRQVVGNHAFDVIAHRTLPTDAVERPRHLCLKHPFLLEISWLGRRDGDGELAVCMRPTSAASSSSSAASSPFPPSAVRSSGSPPPSPQVPLPLSSLGPSREKATAALASSALSAVYHDFGAPVHFDVDLNSTVGQVLHQLYGEDETHATSMAVANGLLVNSRATMDQTDRRWSAASIKRETWDQLALEF